MEAVWLCLLVLISLSAYAQVEDTIFSGTIEHGDIINESNLKMYFQVEPFTERVIVEIEPYSFVVENGECEFQNNFRICVNRINFSYRQPITIIDIYEADVTIKRIAPDIETEILFETTTFLIGEQEVGLLSIVNVGTVSAEDAVITIPIPKQFEVVSVETCSLTAAGIQTAQTFGGSQEKKCSFKLKAVDAGDFSLRANATYFDGVTTVTQYSDTVDGTVQNLSVVVSFFYDATNITLGDMVDLNIVIENTNEDFEASVDEVAIAVPDGFSLVTKDPSFRLSGNALHWDGRMKPAEKENFTITLQAVKEGNYTLQADSSFKVQGTIRKSSNREPIDVQCDCPIIDYFYFPEPVPGNETTVRVLLVNPSTSNSYSSLASTYLDGTQTKPLAANAQLKPRESIELLEYTYTVPFPEDAENISLQIGYQTPFGEQYAEEIHVPLYLENGKNFTRPVAEIAPIASSNGTLEKPRDDFIKEIFTAQEGVEKNPFLLIGIVVAVLILVSIIVMRQHIKRKRAAEAAMTDAEEEPEEDTES